MGASPAHATVFTYDKKVFGEEFKDCKVETLLKTSWGGSGLDLDEEVRSNHFKPFLSQISVGPLDDISEAFHSDIVCDRVVFIGGKGGSGKTTALMKALPNRNVCYTTSCWNLIQEMKNKYPDILGYSLPNLTGKVAGKACEKIWNPNIKYVVVDELTLIDRRAIDDIKRTYPNNFIFLIGDIDKDNFFYQCTLPAIEMFKLCSNVQYIQFTKSYRFDSTLDSKLNDLRAFMRSNRNKLGSLEIYVRKEFSMCFRKREDVVFNSDDVGICSLNSDIPVLTDYFVSKGTTPKFFVANTNKNKNQLKGKELLERPEHSNYEEKLFKTIHSFQGLDLTHDNKIIICISKVFDFNLYYTALSRARRLDQIIILE